MSEQFIVSDGISSGQTWGTYRRKPSGALQRVVSKALPLRSTREEAQADLDAWLRAKGWKVPGEEVVV